MQRLELQARLHFKSAGTAGNTPEEPIMQLEKLRFRFSLNTFYLRLIAIKQRQK